MKIWVPLQNSSPVFPLSTRSFQTQPDYSFPSQCHSASVNPDGWSFWSLSPLMSHQDVMKELDRKWSGDSRCGIHLFRHWIKSFDQLFSICDVHLIQSLDSIAISLFKFVHWKLQYLLASFKSSLMLQLSFLVALVGFMGEHKVLHLNNC